VVWRSSSPTVGRRAHRRHAYGRVAANTGDTSRLGPVDHRAPGVVSNSCSTRLVARVTDDVRHQVLAVDVTHDVAI
jgi:hypothetical protein